MGQHGHHGAPPAHQVLLADGGPLLHDTGPPVLHKAPSQGLAGAGARTRTPSWLLGTMWALCSLTYGVQICVVGPTTSILAAQTHSTEADLAPVLGLGGICTLVGGMPSGWLVDHVPGNPMLAVTLALQALGLAAIPRCITVLQLALVYASVSLTFNVIGTGITVLSIWQFSHSARATAFMLNVLSAVFGLGGIIAPQLVKLAASRLGSGVLAYYLVSLLSLAMAAAIACLPSPPREPSKREQQQQHREGARSSMSGVRHADALLQPPSKDGSVRAGLRPHPEEEEEGGTAAWGQGGDALIDASVASTPEVLGEASAALEACAPVVVAGTPADGVAGATRSRAVSRRASHAHERGSAGSAGGTGAAAAAAHRAAATPGRPWGVLVPALLLAFANISIELGFAGWIFMFCKAVIGMDDHASEDATSLYWIAFTATRCVGAFAVAFVHASTLLHATMPLAVAGAAGALLWPTRATTLASVLLVGAGAACGFPNMLSIAAEAADLDGHVNGIISTVAGVALTVMPYVVPWLAKLDPARGFSWLMIATLAMAVMQWAALAQLMAAVRAHKLRAGRSRRSSEAADLHTPLLHAAEEEP